MVFKPDKQGSTFTYFGPDQLNTERLSSLMTKDSVNNNRLPDKEIDLSKSEQDTVQSFSRSIDLNDPDHVILYGSDAQKKISLFADNILSNARNTDAGEITGVLADLAGNLQDFEAAANKPTGLRSLFSNAKTHISIVRTNYEKVTTHIEKIAFALENNQIRLLKDVAMLTRLYDLNLECCKDLTMYILAGEIRLRETLDNDFANTHKSTAEGKNLMAGKKADKRHSNRERFEKKLYDLKLTRQISMQMGVQIQLLQNNNSLLIERIQSTLVNTLPLWKNQMALALGMRHVREAMSAYRAVTSLTNDKLTDRANSLKRDTAVTAKEMERGVVDLETLAKTNHSLIDTIGEMVRIQAEGRTKRAEAEKTLLQLDNELKQKLNKT